VEERGPDECGYRLAQGANSRITTRSHGIPLVSGVRLIRVPQPDRLGDPAVEPPGPADCATDAGSLFWASRLNARCPFSAGQACSWFRRHKGHGPRVKAAGTGTWLPNRSPLSLSRHRQGGHRTVELSGWRVELDGGGCCGQAACPRTARRREEKAIRALVTRW